MRFNAFNLPKTALPILKDLIDEKAKNIVSVGEYTYGEPPIIRYWGGDYILKIGKFCSLADNITFFLGGDHQMQRLTTSPLFVFFKDMEMPSVQRRLDKRKTTVGNDVWIGSGATIMSGVNISDGAVVGAMSVVASDVPPYAVAVGNPAKVIKYRFESDIIELLLRLKWWDWNEEQIKLNFQNLTSIPTKSLLEKLLQGGENLL